MSVSPYLYSRVSGSVRVRGKVRVRRSRLRLGLDTMVRIIYGRLGLGLDIVD